VPVGPEIRLHFDVDADASDEQLATLIRLTERYYEVSHTLNPTAEVTFSATTKRGEARHA
jgi:uncharacterized OsmC-like protein